MSVWNNWNNAESEDRLQLVFEHRNREYGAYVIRREYDRTMALACAIGLGITTLIVCIPMWLGQELIPKVLIKPPVNPDIHTLKPNTPKAPTTRTYRAPAVPGPPSNPGVPIVDPNFNQIIAPPNFNPGGGRPGGPGLAGTMPGFGERPGSDSTNSPFINNIGPTIPEFYAMPKCGMPCFLDEMRNKIQIPESCLYDAEDLEIELQFVVDLRGNISNVIILKNSPCPGFAEAAVRVVQNSGAWIPGQSNGKFVKSYRRLPFRLTKTP